MKSVITYTLDSCTKCMKCLKNCPTNAITMNEGRVIISDEKCINCGKCVASCHSQGIQAKGSTLVDIENYDYSICMVPSALISDCKNTVELEELFYAIKLLGFDEVVDISDIEGQIISEAHNYISLYNESCRILSFCPVINSLIQVNHPMLLNNIIPINYPSEIAAKRLRKMHEDKGKVGIFNCCECESKLALAKYPYGNTSYEVDHALSIVDIFPQIKSNMKKGRLPVTLCKEGLQSCNPSMLVVKDKDLVADGFDKVVNILEHAEFGLLDDFKLLALFPCFNGCLGGRLLWGNSYLIKSNIFELTLKNEKPISDLPFEELYKDNLIDEIEDNRSMMEKLQFFSKVNEQLEKLPGYDCTACGLPSCRIMAEEIVNKNKTLNDCKILIRTEMPK